MSLQLEGKVILITGGSTGIGRECARAYAREGARVALVARSGQASAEAAEELGGDHLGFACDVSQGSEIASALRRVLDHYGRLDCIHNNAGISDPAKALHETSDEEWDALFSTNVKSILHTLRHGLEALKASRGCVLNTSSLAGVIGQERHAAYTATKGAMNSLTLSMALDYAPFGVRVNAVCPAGTWTPMLHQWCAQQPEPETIKNYLNGIHPLGYCPEGDVVADACVFLISERARFVTGHIMHVSGGAELGYRRSS